MQRFKYFFPALLLLLTISISACTDKTVKIYSANIPVYMETEAFRTQNFVFESPKPLLRPGKIYIYNNLLLVNDLMTGVHFFDNSNPAAPIDLGFLPVHANADIAVRNDIMYLDSYTDLLAFNISSPSDPYFVCRVEDVFDFQNYGYLSGIDNNYPTTEVDESQGVVTGWTVGETVEEVNNSYNNWNFTTFDNSGGGPVSLGDASSSGLNNAGGQGIAGSTAKFAIKDNILYTLEIRELGVFDITSCPAHLRDITLDRASETLFPYDGNLFIGTTTGMLIYDISTPASPSFVSLYAHVRSCDPVVVQGDKAFVTLSSGTNCAGIVNQLHVIDLSNIALPTVVHGFDMTNPKGLGLDGNTLFLCDGADGLKVFDKTDLSAIDQNMISQFSGITAADVIPLNGVLLMTSEEGIFQYDYSDLNNIVQLSLIPRQ